MFALWKGRKTAQALAAIDKRRFTVTAVNAFPKSQNDDEYHPTDMELVQIVRSRRGPDILHNPWANKVCRCPGRKAQGPRGRTLSIILSLNHESLAGHSFPGVGKRTSWAKRLASYPGDKYEAAGPASVDDFDTVTLTR